VNQTRGQEPASSNPPTAPRRAVDDHGRAVTATPSAASWYRHAQRAADLSGARASLQLAITTDPAFALAIVDLAAITRTIPRPITGRQTNWERHHIEVVRSASSDNFDRAADLLRELLAAIGCDPLATRIVIDLAERAAKLGDLADLTRQVPGCQHVFG